MSKTKKEYSSKDSEPTYLDDIVKNVAALLKSTTEAARKKALAATLGEYDIEYDIDEHEKNAKYIITRHLLPKKGENSDDEESFDVLPVKELGPVDKLKLDPAHKITSSAVVANPDKTFEKICAKVLKVAEAFIKERRPVVITPGFASGVRWEPEPTGESASYSRWNKKYCKKGYTTMFLVYSDVKLLEDSEATWNARKKKALDVEEDLHIKLKEKYGKKYKGKQGGSQPSYQNYTNFFVYIAIKC